MPISRPLYFLSLGSLSNIIRAYRVPEQAYAFLLLLIIVGSGHTLVFLDQFILSTSRFKFPFPLAAACLQLWIVYVLLLAIALVVKGPVAVQATLNSLSKAYHYALDPPIRYSLISGFRRISTIHFRNLPAFLRYPWKDGPQYTVLASLLATRVLFMNCSLAWSNAHNFELTEIVSFVLLAWISPFTSKDVSLRYISAGLNAALNIGIANIRQNLRLTWDTKFVLVGSVFTSACFPHMLDFVLQTALVNSIAEPHRLNHAGFKRSALKNKLYMFWHVLHCITLLATLMLTTLTIVSGGATQVWHSYYFLANQSFLMLMIASGASLGLHLCISLLLVYITGPLIVSFIPVLRVAYQLWTFGQASGINFIRLVVGSSSGIIFILEKM